MGEFFDRNIVEPGKLPLLVCLGAFIVTFLATRVVTRMIRAGVGPFKNNVSAKGLHVHHAVPGIVLLLCGAILAIAAPPHVPWREIAGAMIGAGAALVLDEFALILHLDDVYWQAEGRLSVEMVALATASMGFALVGVSPLGVDGLDTGQLLARVTAIVAVGINAIAVWVAFRKGKRAFALIGAFVPLVSWIGAVRLAEPESSWARRHYDDAKRARAVRRHDALAARWGPLLRRASDFVAGTMGGPPLP